MADFIPKIDILLRNNSHEEYFSYFQQVRYAGETDWTWHISAVKIFMWDDEGKPLLTITTAYPINKIKSLEVKAQNLLDENTFLLKNMGLFASLGKREKVVLKQVALGKTSAEIADELFISADTVQTHRRNIRNKLGITSAVEFAEYARAFDLV
jgi:DNA-binding CsgD family transcriptional regulator